LALLCEEFFSKLETQSFYLGTLGIKDHNGLQLHIKLYHVNQICTIPIATTKTTIYKHVKIRRKKNQLWQ
jgi:hypothetical protein